jgi:hypothetical protein
MALLHRWIRNSHLYAGLFISPFLLLFAISVFYLNHAKIQPDAWTAVDTLSPLRIPDNLSRAEGRDAVSAARAIADAAGVDGEIGFTRYTRSTGHFSFPISKPGREALVDMDTTSGSVTVSSRPTSLLESLAYLHKMPGPHNVAIRGNWAPTVLWRGSADLTIYLTLFITISGLYLWWALKAERRIGVVVLSAGLATLVVLVHALFH